MQIGLATYSMRNRIRENKGDMKVVADFMVKNGIKFVEINNIFTKPEKLSDDCKMFRSWHNTYPTYVDGNNSFKRTNSEETVRIYEAVD